MFAFLVKLLDLLGFISQQIEKKQTEKAVLNELASEAQERIDEVPQTTYSGNPKRTFDWLRKRNSL